MAQFPIYSAAGVPYVFPPSPYSTRQFTTPNPDVSGHRYYENDPNGRFNLPGNLPHTGHGVPNQFGALNPPLRPPFGFLHPLNVGRRKFSYRGPPMYGVADPGPGYSNVRVGSYWEPFVKNTHWGSKPPPTAESRLAGNFDIAHGHWNIWEPPVGSSRMPYVNNYFSELETLRLRQRQELSDLFRKTQKSQPLESHLKDDGSSDEVQSIFEKIDGEIVAEYRFLNEFDGRCERKLVQMDKELNKQRARINENLTNQNIDIKPSRNSRQEDGTLKPQPSPSRFNNNHMGSRPSKPTVSFAPQQARFQQTQPHNKGANSPFKKPDGWSAQLQQRRKPPHDSTPHTQTKPTPKPTTPPISSATLSPRTTVSNQLSDKQALSDPPASLNTDKTLDDGKEGAIQSSNSGSSASAISLPVTPNSNDSKENDDIVVHDQTGTAEACDNDDGDDGSDDDDSCWDTGSQYDG